MMDADGTATFALQITRIPLDKATSVAPLIPESAGLPLSAADAQQIMDELWRVGVRPNNGEGAPAQVEAIRAHLEDMREFAFAVTRYQGPAVRKP